MKPFLTLTVTAILSISLAFILVFATQKIFIAFNISLTDIENYHSVVIISTFAFYFSLLFVWLGTLFLKYDTFVSSLILSLFVTSIAILDLYNMNIVSAIEKTESTSMPLYASIGGAIFSFLIIRVTIKKNSAKK